MADTMQFLTRLVAVLPFVLLLQACATAPPPPPAQACGGPVVGEMALYAMLSSQGVRTPPAAMTVTRELCGYRVDLEPNRFHSVILLTDATGKIVQRIDPP